MSETQNRPAVPPSAPGTVTLSRIGWWIAGIVAIIVVLMVAAVVITAIVVDGSG